MLSFRELILILSISLRTYNSAFLSDTTFVKVWGRQCISDEREIYEPGCHYAVNGTTISYCMCDWDMCNYDFNPIEPTEPPTDRTEPTEPPTTQSSSTKLDGSTFLSLFAIVFLFWA